MDFQNRNNFQNQNQNQNLANQAMNNQGMQNIAQGFNAQPDMEIAAEMNQKTPGEIQRILASKSLTGLEFGYVPFPESGPNQMNNQAKLNNQYNVNPLNNNNDNNMNIGPR